MAHATFRAPLVELTVTSRHADEVHKPRHAIFTQTHFDTSLHRVGLAGGPRDALHARERAGESASYLDSRSQSPLPMLLNSPARGHDDVSRRDSRPTSTPSRPAGDRPQRPGPGQRLR